MLIVDCHCRLLRHLLRKGRIMRSHDMKKTQQKLCGGFLLCLPGEADAAVTTRTVRGWGCVGLPRVLLLLLLLHRSRVGRSLGVCRGIMEWVGAGLAAQR